VLLSDFVNDGGADGIAFVLQPISTSVGSLGGGMGVAGISPSIAVTLDTYQNSSPDSDPIYDHIAFQRNGDINHASANNLAGPIQASVSNINIEDGVYHKLRVVWNAATKTLTAYFDGTQRLTLVNDFVNTTFGGNPLVFWGFTGATGGLSNTQKFCTALTPAWNFLPTQKRCVGEPIQFVDATISFATIIKMYWNFGDGSNIDSVNTNPVHIYTTANTYTVTQRVIGADGCEQTNTQTVIVGSKPFASFSINDSCINNTIQFTSNSFVSVGTINNWYWDFDNAGATSTVQNPTQVYASHGLKYIRMAVKSLQGCESDTITQPVRIYARPVSDFSFTDSLCLGSSYTFNGTATSPDGLPVTNWQWMVDGAPLTNNTATLNHIFTTQGSHTVTINTSTTGAANCYGVAVTKNVFVVDKPRPAIRSFRACEDVAAILQDSSYTLDGLPITQWWWDLGNGNFSTQQNPNVTYLNSGIFDIQLVVWNSKGCKSDTLKVSIKVSTTPLVDFVFSEPKCDNKEIEFTDVSVSDTTITTWTWSTASTVFSTQQNPSYSFNPGTNNTVSLVVTNASGCVSATMQQSFVMKTKPRAAMQFSDACKFDEVIFTANETTGSIGITEWHWSFGGTSAPVIANPTTHTYTVNGNYPVSVYGISAEGCPTDTISRPITIYGTDAFAGNDMIAAPNQSVQLNATGGLSYQWTPSTGLSAANISNPVAINNADRTYYLRAYTPEGCESFDTINIKIYKGPEIYVPTAFTPNGDGRNDILKPFVVGISSFEYFVLYNRYGEIVFKSNDAGRGWDGRVKGQDQQTGTFVWMVSGVDFTGKKIFKKGTVLLIR